MKSKTFLSNYKIIFAIGPFVLEMLSNHTLKDSSNSVFVMS